MPYVAFHTFPVPDNSSPAFSTPCNMVPIIPVPHFPVSHFQLLAFSAPPTKQRFTYSSASDELIHMLTVDFGRWHFTVETVTTETTFLWLLSVHFVTWLYEACEGSIEHNTGARNTCLLSVICEAIKQILIGEILMGYCQYSPTSGNYTLRPNKSGP